jgi:hypothetical protein
VSYNELQLKLSKIHASDHLEKPGSPPNSPWKIDFGLFPILHTLLLLLLLTVLRRFASYLVDIFDAATFFAASNTGPLCGRVCVVR